MEHSSLNACRAGVNPFVRLVLDLTNPGWTMQGGRAMTSRAITRDAAEPLTRLAGACALILFVIVVILPH